MAAGKRKIVLPALPCGKVCVNRLPLHRVDELVRHFDAGLSIRATARATGAAPRTVMRYHRAWRSARPSSGTLLCRLSPGSLRALSTAAIDHGESPSLFASRLLEAIADQGLAPIVLA